MSKFFKENLIFSVGSIMLVLIVSSASIMQNMQASDQKKAGRNSPSGVSDASLQVLPQTGNQIPISANLVTVPAPAKTVVKKTAPKPAPVTTPAVRRRVTGGESGEGGYFGGEE